MTIDERIPAMSDKELDNLHANALRLAQTGKPAQKVEAERLIPIVAAEIDRRRQEKDAAAEAKKAAQREARAQAGRKRSTARKAAAPDA